MCSHRSIFALFVSASVVAGISAAIAADDPKSSAALAPAVEPPTKPAEQSPLPLVLRIDKTALTRYSDSDIDRTGNIDKMVLGSHCTGESHTTGTIRAELLPDSQEAAFDLYFRGRTVSKTKGVQEPGVVWSRTFTDFTSKRRIIFEPRKGFVVVGENEIETQTKLVFDGFGATRNLGRRLITRITAKKSYQLAEQARLIADRDNKKEVAESFTKESDQQVAAANEGLDLVRYVNGFLGNQKNLQLHAKSTTDFIYIGIGPEGEKYAPMAEMPQGRGRAAPMEIWVHTSILSGPVATSLKLITPDVPIPLPAQAKILSALALPVTGSQKPMDVDFYNGWLILGLPDDAAQTPPSMVDNVKEPNARKPKEKLTGDERKLARESR